MPVASASAVVVIVLLAAWGFGATGLLRGIYRGGKAAAVASVEETHTQQSAVGMVEVPSLTGMTLDEASTVVQAAGFALVVTEEGTPAVAASRLVTDQDPQAGTVAPLGSAVEIVVPPLQGSASLASSRKKPRRFVVVIDPVHRLAEIGRIDPQRQIAGQINCRDRLGQIALHAIEVAHDVEAALFQLRLPRGLCVLNAEA